MNLRFPDYWDRGVMFANAIRSMNRWTKPTTSDPVAADANGWPLEDARAAVWTDFIHNTSGTYLLQFESGPSSTVTVQTATATMGTLTRDAVSGVSTVSFSINNSSALQLLFSNTGGYVRNVKLMRPIAPGSTTSHALTEEFSRLFLGAIAPFKTIRYMDYQAINSNPSVTWSDRATPAHTTVALRKANASINPPKVGAPIEHIINLANLTSTDSWIHIPLLADDNYIRELAKLLRDGNQYTDNKGINSNLKIYLEYSNEVWNNAAAFTQTGINQTLANDEQAAGDAYGYDNDGNVTPAHWARRRVGRKLVEISRIFREEFGDARMMTQVRPIMAWQSGNTNTGYQSLVYLEDIYIPMTYPGRALNYYIYGAGGAGYYGPNGTVFDINALWTDNMMVASAWEAGIVKPDAQLSYGFGLKRIAYESGLNLQGYVLPSGLTETQALQVQSDSRTNTALRDHQQIWNDWGGELTLYYVLTGGDGASFTSGYNWSYINTVEDLSLQKYVTAAAQANELRTPPNRFAAVPGSLSGNQFSASSPLGVTPGTTPASVGISTTTVVSMPWRSYQFYVPTTGTYTLSITYTGSASGQLQLVADNTIASTGNIAGGGALTTTVTWEKGVHSIRARTIGASGTNVVTIQTVSVSVN